MGGSFNVGAGTNDNADTTSVDKDKYIDAGAIAGAGFYAANIDRDKYVNNSIGDPVVGKIGKNIRK